jgi:hypothetical protein
MNTSSCLAYCFHPPTAFNTAQAPIPKQQLSGSSGTMSTQVPAVVKAADLARFAMRASQLEKAKPVISYYC